MTHLLAPLTRLSLLAQDVDVVPAAADESGSTVLYALIIVAAFLIVPFVLGEVVARLLKMKDRALRFGVVFFAFAVGLSPFVNLAMNSQPLREAFRLGIDLAGGMNMVFEVDAEAAAKDGKEISPQLMDQMVGAIGRRINPSGTEEITVRKVGTRKIEVIVPDVDPFRAREVQERVTRLGSLEFAILATRIRENYENLIERATAEDFPDDQDELIVGERVAARWVDVARDAETGEEKDLKLDRGELAKRTVERKVEQEDGTEKVEEITQYLVIVEPENARVTGQFLTRAGQTSDPQNGRPAVSFTFNLKGASRFQRLTAEHRPEGQNVYLLGILLDGKLESAPGIQAIISDRGQITGDFTVEEVKKQVDILNAGALQVPLKDAPRVNIVDPTLGKTVVEKGRFAIIIASVTVLVFMIVYYRLAGVIANLCLLFNLVLVLGTMAIIDATLTLPGIAGIVLTIGMAVDANVLIFERIREEKLRGSSIRVAIQNGFDRAFTTIVDANLTTLITAVVLYIIGTDQVKGFAVTLFVGIVMSMFTALYVGRLIFEVLERKGFIKDLGMMSIVGNNTSVDFIGKRKIAGVFSALIIIGGLAALYSRGTENLDIDFTGGSMVSFEFLQPHDLEDVREPLVEQFDSNITVESLREFDTQEADDVKRFRLRSRLPNSSDVRDRVNQAFAEMEGMELVKVALDYTEPEPVEDSERVSSELTFTTQQGGADGETETVAREIPLGTVSSMIAEKLAAIDANEEGEGKYGNDEAVAGLFEVEGTAGTGLERKSGTSRVYSEFEVVASSELDTADLTAALSEIQSELASEPYFAEEDTFDTSVAGEMQQQAILALLVSLVAIVAYIWFRFQRITFGFAAVVALVHDVLVVVGMVAIGSLVAATPVGPLLGLTDFKINLPMIAAFLTIVGYSLNDTIVVFDRIREVRGKNPALTEDMINRSLNQTLARTLLTSVTTMLVVFILYVSGGEGIKGFAYCLVLGVLVGTYSSIYVASPVLLWLMNRSGVAASRAAAPSRSKKATT